MTAVPKKGIEQNTSLLPSRAPFTPPSLFPLSLSLGWLTTRMTLHYEQGSSPSMSQSQKQAAPALEIASACNFPPRWEPVVTQRAWPKPPRLGGHRPMKQIQCVRVCVCSHAHVLQLRAHGSISKLCRKTVQHHFSCLVLYGWAMLLLTTPLTPSLRQTQNVPG